MQPAVPQCVASVYERAVHARKQTWPLTRSREQVLGEKHELINRGKTQVLGDNSDYGKITASTSKNSSSGNLETLMKAAEAKDQTRDEGVIPGRYIHYTGVEYQVIGTAIDKDTRKKVVVFQSGTGLWTRSLELFNSKVVVGGIEQKRYDYIE